jgi:RNA polymerase sigma-70 factor, ECF subfamily
MTTEPNSTVLARRCVVPGCPIPQLTIPSDEETPVHQLPPHWHRLVISASVLCSPPFEQLLTQENFGTGQEMDELFSIAYDELRRIASAVKHRDPFATVTTTALVGQAWLKLSDSTQLRFQSEQHFRATVVKAMRQILVDSARRRRSLKRDGEHTEVDATLPAPDQNVDDALAIHDALLKLAELSPEQARIVEAKYFGDMEVSEIAKLLDVSESTIARQLRVARAWLAIELSGS